jgi:16S rRNA (adenine1518-N6/adenine1519-N6)-dimethyltransferase
MDIDQLKNLLRRYGLKPNFTYGQNFLVDDLVLQDIVDAAEVTSEDNILEIGPGIGNLTRLLCERAGFVLSVEKDPKFLPVLKAIKKEYKNFWYEIADALEFDFQRGFREQGRGVIEQNEPPPLTPHPYKVVANIPYFITGKILKMLMTAKHKPTSITILTQKEVARNIIAKAGELSVLAISVQLYGEPKIIQIVQAKSFYPAPKVDSAVLQIKIFDKPKYEVADEKKFFKILKACFTGKRKQIHNTLKNNLMLSKEDVDRILSDTKINPAARPQELSIEDWIKLVNKITASS